MARGRLCSSIVPTSKLLLAQRGRPDPSRLWHYRNLENAFYENPATRRQLIMGSGDEVALRFSARNLPPLPFHAMSRYPYSASEHYPEDASHQSYLREYNTRPALRLIRSLVTCDDSHYRK